MFQPSPKYLIRIAKVLMVERKIGVSALAIAARMNQQRCNAHLRWFEERGYVKIESVGERRIVAVTEEGIEQIGRVISFFIVFPLTVGASILVMILCNVKSWFSNSPIFFEFIV